jgi:hypothetical protein
MEIIPAQAKANEFEQDYQADRLPQYHASRGQPLGKGEVESSILSCSTIFPQIFQWSLGRALPFPPLNEGEQNLKGWCRLGEIRGGIRFLFSTPC